MNIRILFACLGKSDYNIQMTTTIGSRHALYLYIFPIKTTTACSSGLERWIDHLTKLLNPLVSLRFTIFTVFHRTKSHTKYFVQSFLLKAANCEYTFPLLFSLQILKVQRIELNFWIQTELHHRKAYKRSWVQFFSSDKLIQQIKTSNINYVHFYSLLFTF